MNDKSQAPTLKTVSFHDGITIRIPEHWQCRFTEDKRWACDDIEGDENEITLWIDFDVFSAPEKLTQTSLDDAAELTLDSNKSGEEKYLATNNQQIGNARITFKNYMTEDGEEGPLTIYVWHHISISGNKFILAHFNLVVGTDTIPDEEETALVTLIEKEVHNAKIEDVWD